MMCVCKCMMEVYVCMYEYVCIIKYICMYVLVCMYHVCMHVLLVRYRHTASTMT